MARFEEVDFSVLDDISTKDGNLGLQVYTSLLTAILDLRIPPGAVLNKGLICSHLGVSRAPVSEAIARLSFDELVDVVPQSSSRVSFLSMDKIRESAFLREALELAAIEIVATTRTDDQLKQLKRNLRFQELLSADGDADGFYAADEEFHDLLMQFTGFDRLSETVRNVSLKLKRARVLILPSPGRMSKTLEEHWAIMHALQLGDQAVARDTMAHHLGRLLPKIVELETIQPELFGPIPGQSELSA